MEVLAMAQLHKTFTDSQVKEMFQRYLNNEIEGPYTSNRSSGSYLREFTDSIPYKGSSFRLWRSLCGIKIVCVSQRGSVASISSPNLACFAP